LTGFITARRANWQALRAGLAPLEGVSQGLLQFTLPTHATAWSPAGCQWDSSGCRSDPSWFGFLLRVGSGAPVSREVLAQRLEANGIGTRMLFGGNLLRQPALLQVRRDDPAAVRSVGEALPGADALMQQALFLGVYPGLTSAMLQRIQETVLAAVERP
jgi:CDP-6-deoxy-D-xylo-4-hexulose-3-dehydrase